MTKIVIIGGGVIGAAIAYELSQDSHFDLTLIEEKTPAVGSTGAALGVLMGIISHKIKGRQWKLRQNSLERYETLIPELKNLTGKHIPYNCSGILKLLSPDEDLGKWQELVKIRENQGYNLEILDKAQLNTIYPYLNLDYYSNGIYSPRDRQLDPPALTHALIKGASLRGVNCKFGLKAHHLIFNSQEDANNRQCTGIQTQEGTINLDYLIIAAGLGSTPLIEDLQQNIKIEPILGQALKIKLDNPPENTHFTPVVTANDVHVVPLEQGNYWVGATVEFPDKNNEIQENREFLNKIYQNAIAFYPLLQEGKIVEIWSGRRPRPQNQAAPIIEILAGYQNIILSSGHYRNGVLLAPATALEVRKLLPF